MTSSVDKVMDFFIQKTSIVIHHLLLVIAGIPVVFVSLLFFVLYVYDIFFDL